MCVWGKKLVVSHPEKKPVLRATRLDPPREEKLPASVARPLLARFEAHMKLLWKPQGRDVRQKPKQSEEALKQARQQSRRNSSFNPYGTGEGAGWVFHLRAGEWGK